MRRDKTLLILDGLEPLQSYLDYERGKLKDPALAVLVAELARQNQGLCIITTREAVADLTPFPETTCQQDLEQISAEAGRALLRVGGVQGTDAELEQVARDFGLHALALNLLAAYVHEFSGHHISNAAKIPDLDVPVAEGKHPRRVMAAFAARFGEGSEVELLRMLGLFDRPADGGAIAAVRAAPAIPNLTDHIQSLSEAGWLQLVNKLRRVRLIAPESKHHPDTLDTHPLVREHFGQQLAHEYPTAWREAHSRLYEYYRTCTKQYPDTLDEMELLYRAVGHASSAGRYEAALEQVYLPRILQGDKYYSLYTLSAHGTELASLAGFFEESWSKPSKQISPARKALVLRQAGYCLRALGRLTDSLGYLQRAMDYDKGTQSWKDAANDATILSNIYVFIGRLPEALECIDDGVRCADLSGNRDLQSKTRAMRGAVLHHSGDLQAATVSFREAEDIHAGLGNCMILDGQWGYGYNDLLLDQGQYNEVIHRVHTSSSWWLQENRQQDHYSKACDLLALGRAEMALKQDIETARLRINDAVEHFRKSGRNDHLIRALLVRAQFYQLQETSNLNQARKDVDEAMGLCTRGGIKFHEADCYLEYARLHLTCGEKDKAQESLAKARKMIEEMGYHRRDQEVKELETQL